MTLATTINVKTGNGHVMMDIIMTATDRVSNAETGSFIALYTSRSTGHFDVNACPDENGIGEGTYTFETKHELNDVSSPQAARSGGREIGRSAIPVDQRRGRTPGSDRSGAQSRGGRESGPGVPAGLVRLSPSTGEQHNRRTSPCPPTAQHRYRHGHVGYGDWRPKRRRSDAHLICHGPALPGRGGQGGRGASGGRASASTIKTTKESKKVSAGESVQFDATAKGKFDGADIDAPIKGTFTGTKSLDPDGEEQDPPASFTFEAGDEIGDKGTIELEQVGVRGIGKKKLEFEVGPTDYKWDQHSAWAGRNVGHEMRRPEGCVDGHTSKDQATAERSTSLARRRTQTTAPAHMVMDFTSAGTIHWDLNGSVTFVDGEEPASPSSRSGS